MVGLNNEIVDTLIDDTVRKLRDIGAITLRDSIYTERHDQIREIIKATIKLSIFFHTEIKNGDQPPRTSSAEAAEREHTEQDARSTDYPSLDTQHTHRRF